MKDEDMITETTRKAGAGDAAACYNLGSWHEYGDKGVDQDENKAAAWFERAHNSGDARGTAALGSCYVYGRGVEKDPTLGIMLYTQAALAGSKHACCARTRAQLHVSQITPRACSLARLAALSAWRRAQTGKNPPRCVTPICAHTCGSRVHVRLATV